MKLCTPDEMPGMIPGRICRQSRLMSVAGAIAMSVMVTGFPLFFLWKTEPSPWIWIPAVLALGLFVYAILGWAVRSLRSDNWLMRIAPDGLWINLRSYLNQDFAPAATVAFIQYSEIASL